MKNFKIIVASILIISIFTFVSCDSLLKEDTFGRPTSDELLKDESNIIALVGQTYADLKWLHDHWGWWGLNTVSADECICPIRMPGSHWADGNYWQPLATHNWTERDISFKNVWNKCYSGAMLCNKVLWQINSYVKDEKIKLKYSAEVKTLRAIYYYTLLDMFGKVPVVENWPTEGSARQYSPAELFDFIERELKTNAKYLEYETGAQNYGRVNRGVAYGYLSRLYLNAVKFKGEPKYEECINYSDSVIDLGVYKIENNYLDNFLLKNENSNENMFVIVEDGNEKFDKQEDNKMMNKLRINLLTLHYQHQTAFNLIEKPWNGFCAPEAFYDMYDANDKRKNDTWFIGPVRDPISNEILKDENKTEVIIVKQVGSINNATWNDGARFIKYQVDTKAENRYSENDFVLMRYAEILYNKAEATLRAGKDLSGILSNPDFQKIRTRANMPVYTSATFTLPEILNERGREFSWEGLRRRDLIRFNQFALGVWKDKPAVSATKDWFPIPHDIIMADPENLEQNEGYNR